VIPICISVDYLKSHLFGTSYQKSVLQCVAVCCSVLQCVAVSQVSSFRDLISKECVAVCCSVLQCVAVCCSVLASQVASFRDVAALNSLCKTTEVLVVENSSPFLL